MAEKYHSSSWFAAEKPMRGTTSPMSPANNIAGRAEMTATLDPDTGDFIHLEPLPWDRTIVGIDLDGDDLDSGTDLVVAGGVRYLDTDGTTWLFWQFTADSTAFQAAGGQVWGIKPKVFTEAQSPRACIKIVTGGTLPASTGLYIDWCVTLGV